MTIFTSKGLESDNVIISLTLDFDRPTSDEFKNKLFVAITRAKNKVFIMSKNNQAVKNFIKSIL